MDGNEGAQCLHANLPFVHRVLRRAPFCALLLDQSANLGNPAFSHPAMHQIEEAVGDMDTVVIPSSYLASMIARMPACKSLSDALLRVMKVFPEYFDVVLVMDSTEVNETEKQVLMNILEDAGRKAACYHSVNEALEALARAGQSNGVVICSHSKTLLPNHFIQGDSDNEKIQRIVEVFSDDKGIKWLSNHLWEPNL